MNVLAILSQDFLAQLPEDPPVAFSMIVERALEHLAEREKLLDETERSSWTQYENVQHTVMNIIIAAARRLEIAPFAHLDVPRRKAFDSQEFDAFKSDLDHYLTQLVIDNTLRVRRESVPISEKLKDRIRSHLHGMKVQIDAADITEAKRSILHAKLRDFEAALEKDRVPYLAVARILFEILSVTANVVALTESPTMAKLTANIMQAVGEAKAAHDEHRPLPPSEPPRLALPPRRGDPPAPREDFTDLDDEIPF